MRNLFVWPEWTLGLDVDVITSALATIRFAFSSRDRISKPSLCFCGLKISNFSSRLISARPEKLTTLR